MVQPPIAENVFCLSENKQCHSILTDEHFFIWKLPLLNKSHVVVFHSGCCLEGIW